MNASSSPGVIGCRDGSKGFQIISILLIDNGNIVGCILAGPGTKIGSA